MLKFLNIEALSITYLAGEDKRLADDQMLIKLLIYKLVNQIKPPDSNETQKKLFWHRIFWRFWLCKLLEIK